jgi:hypothetical protein
MNHKFLQTMLNEKITAKTLEMAYPHKLNESTTQGNMHERISLECDSVTTLKRQYHEESSRFNYS